MRTRAYKPAGTAFERNSSHTNARPTAALLSAALFSAAFFSAALISPSKSEAADLTSANYQHRAGTISTSSNVGANALQSSVGPSTFLAMDATIAGVTSATPVGSVSTLTSLLPGYLAIVAGSFPTLDLDGDLAQFFLDDDDDGDGLNDEYETSTGFFVSETNTGSSPTSADTDSDGFDDGAEVLAGSDPNDPASTPVAPQVPALAVPLRWLLLAALFALAISRMNSTERKIPC